MFYKKLKNVSCEYNRLNGWNSTLQAAWYIRRVRIIWFLWTKPTIWLLILSFTQNSLKCGAIRLDITAVSPWVATRSISLHTRRRQDAGLRCGPGAYQVRYEYPFALYISYMYSNHRVTATATNCSRTKDTAAAIIFVFFVSPNPKYILRSI